MKFLVRIKIYSVHYFKSLMELKIKKFLSEITHVEERQKFIGNLCHKFCEKNY